jgi:hypothetical protein
VSQAAQIAARVMLLALGSWLVACRRPVLSRKVTRSPWLSASSTSSCPANVMKPNPRLLLKKFTTPDIRSFRFGISEPARRANIGGLRYMRWDCHASIFIRLRVAPRAENGFIKDHRGRCAVVVYSLDAY